MNDQVRQVLCRLLQEHGRGSIGLADGMRIDFGGATGVISLRGATPPSQQCQVIDNDRMERLARKLHRAANEGLLTQDQLDRLQDKFFAHDEQEPSGPSV